MNVPQHSIALQRYTPGQTELTAKKFELGGKLSEEILTKIWSPVVWMPAERAEANFLFADWLVLDFDSGLMTIDEAKRTWCDCAHIIATTRSHTPDHHRLRVCLLFERRVESLAEYCFNIVQQIERYEADGQPKDGARAFFPSKEIVSINRDAEAYRVEVETPPKGWRTPEAWDGTAKPLSRYALMTLQRGAILKGDRDHTLFCLSKDLIKTGMSIEHVFENLRRLDLRPPLSDAYLNAKINAALKNLGKEANGKS